MSDFDPTPPYLCDRQQLSTASDLIVRYGVHAATEAALRAGRSRDVGNHIHFCRWRQIERLIDLLAVGRAQGTVH